MGVDGSVNVINGGLKGESQAHFRNKVGGVLADDVGSEHFAVFFAEEEFDEAFGFTAGLGFPEGLVGELTDFVFDAFFLEGAFGLTDGSDFGVAIGAAGEVTDALDGGAFNEHPFDTLHRFEAGGVGEPRRSGNISDSEDAGDGSLVALIDLDPAAISEGELFSAGEDRCHADGDEAAVGGDFFGSAGVFDRDGDGRAVVLGRGDFGVGQAVDPGLFVAFGNSIGDLIVFDWEAIGHHFHDCDFGAEGIVDVAKFHSDGTRADDDHGLGLLFKDHGFLGGNDRRVIVGKTGKFARLCSSGDDDVFGVEDFGRAVLLFHLDLAAGLDRTEALHIINLVLFKEELDSSGESA